jgi:HPt (histidine-containing phosphotransfer) domain-containing protein
MGMIKSDAEIAGQSASKFANVLIDRQHLSEFTMDDPALQRRFLRLFIEHSVKDLRRMQDASAADMQKAVHSLKSSASGVGAWFVVEYAEHILGLEEDQLYPRRDEIIAVLTARVDETNRHIEQILIDA